MTQFWENFEKPWKTPFLTRFGIFGPPGAKLRFFRNKWFSPVVSLYWPLTFDQKSETSHDPILRKLWKTSKNPIFDPFMPILPKLRFFSKNRFPSLFYIYDPLTSCKKAETSYDPVPVTLRHRRTDGQGVNYRTFKVGPKIIRISERSKLYLFWCFVKTRICESVVDSTTRCVTKG